MRRLNEFIEGVKLFDLPLLNGKFTWVNCRARSRIDRFLLSSDWLDLLKEVGQVAGLRVTSDHSYLQLPQMGALSILFREYVAPTSFF